MITTPLPDELFHRPFVDTKRPSPVGSHKGKYTEAARATRMEEAANCPACHQVAILSWKPIGEHTRCSGPRVKGRGDGWEHDDGCGILIGPNHVVEALHPDSTYCEDCWRRHNGMALRMYPLEIEDLRSSRMLECAG